MALKRVTIQNIADACGLSRNTVSKIFNNRGEVPETTRQLVLNKAQELGYFQPMDETMLNRPVEQNKCILVLSQRNPMNHSFGSLFVTAFTNQVSRAGYTVKMYEVTAEELAQCALPPNTSIDSIAGILGIELFDYDFWNTVCGLKLPTIIVDGYAYIYQKPMPCDLISMENVSSTRILTHRLIQAGAEKLGFVGDINHCNSFYERWNGFQLALNEAGLPLDRDLCIMPKNSSPYYDPDWIDDQLKRLPALPDAFVCVNDYHAIHIMAGLKRRGLQIPRDVMITGFDSSPESAIVEPALTTSAIPGTDMGKIAADLLIDRIGNPAKPFCATYVSTVPQFRGSIRQTAEC
ncbi:MAG: LacI family DNA-binding transcriptional regulator [Lachnospiraceae bacterium]|nr:LacI family DNA-binding transcriptional regulator [Lachnospiraceae bacterium]